MLARPAFFLLALAGVGLALGSQRAESAAPDGGAWKLLQRSRVPAAGAPGGYEVVTREVAWSPRETAVIVCDMWDTHHSLNAARRVVEIAPRMNQVLEKARARGALIIHAPSSCMEPYRDHPARKRAQAAAKAPNLPKDIAAWCYQIPSEEKGQYPLDQSDGGCDTEAAAQKEHLARLEAMGRNPRLPWKTQIDLLKIHDQDAISDSGVEIWNLLEERGIKNVILVGVHTNMCVLGRPFGLRQMAKNGRNVVLVRDMTDTMYNPRRWPYVSHFQGTDLIVEHIEKFVCPTITSDQLAGGRPFKFKGDARPRVAVLIAEFEYHTPATIPPFVKNVLEGRLGLEATVLVAKKENGLPPIAEALAKADLVFLSIRRQALPPGDMAALKGYLAAGKPLVAFRTSSHAFDQRDKTPEGFVTWKAFDPEVLGGNYRGHHPVGPVTTVEAAPGAEKHPILTGLKTPFPSKASLYLAGPLAPSATPLLVGTIPGQKPEPIAWTNAFKKSRIFYTSLGHRDDFERSPEFVRLLENGVRWALNMRVPEPTPPVAQGKR